MPILPLGAIAALHLVDSSQPPVRVILSAVIFCLLGRVAVVGAQDVSAEYRLKAAFVARFPEFVDWPPPAWQGRTTLDVCVLTPNPFGKDLPDILDGQLIGGRHVAIQEVQADSPLTPCHVLYITKESSGRLEVLQRAASLPILTISDAPKFLESGGIIQLQTVNKRIRFEISAVAAERVGLRLSSQLLRLAVNVRSGP